MAALEELSAEPEGLLAGLFLQERREAAASWDPPHWRTVPEAGALSGLYSRNCCTARSLPDSSYRIWGILLPERSRNLGRPLRVPSPFHIWDRVRFVFLLSGVESTFSFFSKCKFFRMLSSGLNSWNQSISFKNGHKRLFRKVKHNHDPSLRFAG